MRWMWAADSTQSSHPSIILYILFHAVFKFSKKTGGNCRPITVKLNRVMIVLPHAVSAATTIAATHHHAMSHPTTRIVGH